MTLARIRMSPSPKLIVCLGLALLLLMRLTVACEAAMAATQPALHHAEMADCEGTPAPAADHPVTKLPCAAACATLPSAPFRIAERVDLTECAAAAIGLIGQSLCPALPPPRTA